METVSKYQQQALDFLKATGTSIKIEFLKYGTHFIGETEKRNIYKIRIKNSRGSYTYNFGQSIQGTKKNEKPSEYDILTSLPKYEIEDFEGFCESFGYEQYNNYGRPNQQTLRLCKACVKEWENVDKLFTSEEIEQLQEIN